MKIGKALFCFAVIILIAGCTQSRKKELILNTLREKHQEAISAFPEEWEKHFRIQKCAVIGGNDQAAVVSGYGTRNSRMYMVGIIFPSNNGQEQILCYTIGENDTKLFLPNNDKKLSIVNTLLSKEGTPQMFRKYAEALGVESFEMLISS
jgi:hypothetical protein